MQQANSTYHTIATKMFVEEISSSRKPTVLDLGCLCDSNIEFLVNMGCKVFVDDFLNLNVRIIKTAQESNLEKCVADLKYPENFFNGILCWDIFHLLEADTAKRLSGKLRQFIKKDGIVLTLFRPEASLPQSPNTVIRYRIVNLDKLRYEPLPALAINQKVYQNRDILAVFDRFSFSNSYILTNGWREVIVRK